MKQADIFELHAEVCQTLANPKRLRILALLAKAEMSVGELADVLDLPLSNVSQHLAILRSHGLVAARKAGQTVHYSLTDRRVIDACTLIRSALLDRLKERGQIARRTDPRYAVFSA